MSWRDIAKKVIAKAIEDVGPDFDKISRNYYPFGDRKYHPYHIWLDEIARQRKEHQPKKDERQSELFPGGDPKYTIEALRERLREFDERNQTQAHCLAARAEKIDRLEEEVRRLNRMVGKACALIDGCPQFNTMDSSGNGNWFCNDKNCMRGKGQYADCWRKYLEEAADNG